MKRAVGIPWGDGRGVGKGVQYHSFWYTAFFWWQLLSTSMCLHKSKSCHHVVWLWAHYLGQVKPSIFKVSLSSFLFNYVSVNSRMEAYIRFTFPCSLSVLLWWELTLTRMTEGSNWCLYFSCLSLDLIPPFFFPLLVNLLFVVRRIFLVGRVLA